MDIEQVKAALKTYESEAPDAIAIRAGLAVPASGAGEFPSLAARRRWPRWVAPAAATAAVLAIGLVAVPAMRQSPPTETQAAPGAHGQATAQPSTSTEVPNSTVPEGESDGPYRSVQATATVTGPADPSSAGGRVPDLATLLGQSDLVVIVNAAHFLKGSGSGYDNETGEGVVSEVVFTDVERQLAHSSGPEAADIVLVRQPGGFVDATRYVYPDSSSMELGKTYLLFLQSHDDGIFTLADNLWGQFPLDGYGRVFMPSGGEGHLIQSQLSGKTPDELQVLLENE